MTVGAVDRPANSWPNAGAYATAARAPDEFFVDALFRSAELRKSPLGIPLPATGRNAVVFKATGADGNDLALRCFTNPPLEGRERYHRISSRLRALALPLFPGVNWNDEAVEVDGERWPMLDMDWVEGLTLDQWVTEALGDPVRLRGLADEWVTMCHVLEDNMIGHGDLQHGNVLVDGDDQLHLVDLDGIWIPSLAELPAGEFGHTHYQHPGRIKSRPWGPRVDGFSALVIHLSLVALAHDPELWERHNDGGNNLIFSADDFGDLDSTLWQELAAMPVQVSAASRRLTQACTLPCEKLVGPVDMLDLEAEITVTPMPEWLNATVQARSQPAAALDEAGIRAALPAPPVPAAQLVETSHPSGVPIWLAAVMVALAVVMVVVALVAL
ncbi:MAG: hypothetical protein V3V01_20880 [Acidimicrobiales bacterium]